MNVPSPDWASVFPASPQPLSAALRSAFEARNPVPSELQKLLKRLERRISRESANDP
jgi:hypothetical protein